MSKLTLIGFQNYLEADGDSLFKQLTLPDGINREILINNILLRGGEFEVLYSNPYFMQDAIGIWSIKSQPTFERWVKALSIKYDPLNNYDRTEEWTETDTGTVSGSSSTESGTDTEAKVSAYNSATYQPNNQMATSADSSTTDQGSHDNLNVRKGRAYGNIGVTTSQQMLEAELNIAKWNLIDQITDLFLNEFVIPIY